MDHFPFEQEAVVQRCSVKKVFLEFRKIRNKLQVPESPF